MPSVNDLIQVKQFFNNAGNTALMVSYWKIDGIAGDVPTMAQMTAWFHATYGERIVPFTLSSFAGYVRTVIDNLTDVGEFGDFSDDIPGEVAGDILPAFNAIAIRQNCITRLTRAGQKRLPFIGEAMASGSNVIIDSGDLVELLIWFGEAATAQDPLDVTNFVTLTPVVVGRIEDPVGSGNYVLDLSRINPVESATVVRMTHQNSRTP